MTNPLINPKNPDMMHKGIPSFTAFKMKEQVEIIALTIHK